MADDLIMRAIRFTTTTKPNSIDNRRAIELIRELLQHINDLELKLEEGKNLRGDDGSKT